MATEEEVIAALALTNNQGLLWAFTNFMHAASDAPLIYSIGAGLTLAAAFAPRQDIPGTPVHPSAFWAMEVGESGSRKGKAIQVLQDIMADFDPDRLFPSVQSEGAMVDALSLGDGQFLWLYPELGNFFYGSTKGQHREGLRSALNDTYDGNPIVTQGRKAGKTAVQKARLSILGGITPAHLGQYTTTFDWESGFLNRWGIFEGPQGREYTVTPGAKPIEWEYLRDCLKEVIARRDATGPCLGWTPEAYDLWGATWHFESQWRKTQPPHIQAALTRNQTLGTKVALLFAMTTGPAYEQALINPNVGWYIDRRSAEYGWRVAMMHKNSVLSLLNKIPANDYERDRLAVINTFGLAGEKYMTLGAILATIHPKRSKWTVEKTIETMLLAGDLYQYGDGYGGGTFYSVKPPQRDPDTGLILPPTTGWN